MRLVALVRFYSSRRVVKGLPSAGESIDLSLLYLSRPFFREWSYVRHDRVVLACVRAIFLFFLFFLFFFFSCFCCCCRFVVFLLAIYIYFTSFSSRSIFILLPPPPPLDFLPCVVLSVRCAVGYFFFRLASFMQRRRGIIPREAAPTTVGTPNLIVASKRKRRHRGFPNKQTRH